MTDLFQFVHLIQKGTESERIEKLQQEMMDIQVRYQREIERLEKENRELRRQLLLKDKKNGKKRKMKVRQSLQLLYIVSLYR